MARHDEKNQASTNRNLRGTLVSVLILGAVIVVIWLGVFALLQERY